MFEIRVAHTHVIPSDTLAVSGAAIVRARRAAAVSAAPPIVALTPTSKAGAAAERSGAIVGTVAGAKVTHRLTTHVDTHASREE